MRIKVLPHFAVFFILSGTFSCTWEQLKPQIDCTTDPVKLELIEHVDADCGASNGRFMVNAKGGEGPYAYSSESGNNTEGEFSKVKAGVYKVIATDGRGCNAKLSVTIKNIEGVNIENVVGTDSGCKSTNGSIQIMTSGGEKPYLFSLNGGATQESNVFSGLIHGDYSVSVKDQLGCEITKSVVILSGVSYENSIKDIIKSSCAISGCHNGSESPDLRTLSKIQSNASAIKSKTANKSMPKGSSLSQDQIDKIACWVNDGALAN